MCTRLSCLALLITMTACATAPEVAPDREMMVCQPVQSASGGVVLLCVEVYEDELGGKPTAQPVRSTAPVTSVSQ
jgi:hypothetical protein